MGRAIVLPDAEQCHLYSQMAYLLIAAKNHVSKDRTVSEVELGRCSTCTARAVAADDDGCCTAASAEESNAGWAATVLALTSITRMLFDAPVMKV